MHKKPNVTIEVKVVAVVVREIVFGKHRRNAQKFQ